MFMKHLQLFIAILVVTGLLHIILALYAAGRKPFGAVRAFVALMAAMALYVIGHAFELKNSTLDAKLFWTGIQYLGIPFIPLLYLLASLRILDIGRKIRGPFLYLLFAVPVVVMLSAQTSRWHNLYYGSCVLEYTGGMNLLVCTRGPFYYLHVAYSCLMFAIITFVGFRYISRKNHLLRDQALVILAGAVLSWTVYIIYPGGFPTGGFELNPLMSSAVSFLFAMAFFRYRVPYVLPVARESVFDQMPDGVIIFDMHDRLIDFNPSASVIVSTLKHSYTGQTAAELFAAFPDALRSLRENLSDTLTEAVALEGVDHYYRCRLTPVRDRNEKACGRALILSDVTEQIMLLRQMTVFASYDFLTGAYNRRYFIETCEREIHRARRNGSPAVVLMIDLDHFKKINDTMGHGGGDAVLKAVVARCRELLRGSDVIGRWGGEEFSIFLADTLLPDGEQIAERLRKTIGELRVPYRDKEISFTASFGVAPMLAGDRDGFDELIKRADEALYRAKNGGRNMVIVHSRHTF